MQTLAKSLSRQETTFQKHFLLLNPLPQMQGCRLGEFLCCSGRKCVTSGHTALQNLGGQNHEGTWERGPGYGGGGRPQWSTECAASSQGTPWDYLRAVDGAVQALQRKVLPSQSQRAAPQPALGATTILRPWGSRPRSEQTSVRLSVGFSPRELLLLSRLPINK